MLSHQALESAVLVFERFQPRGLTPLKAAVLLLPPIEGLLTDAVVATECCRCCTRLVLLQDADDLLLREPAAARALLLGPYARRGLSFSLDPFSGGRSIGSPGYFEFDSIVQFSKKTITTVQEIFNPVLQLLGFLFTMNEPTRASSASLQLLRQTYIGLVFSTMIALNTDIQEARMNKQDIFSYNSAAPAAHAYEK